MIDQFIRKVKSYSRLKPQTCLEVEALDGVSTQLLADTFSLDPRNLFLVETDVSRRSALCAQFPNSIVLSHALRERDGRFAGETLLNEIAKPIDLCILSIEGFAYGALTSFGLGLRSIGSLLVRCEHSELFAEQRHCNDVANLLDRRGFRMMTFRYAREERSESTWIRQDLLDLAS